MSFNARTVSFNPFTETYSVNEPDGSQSVSLRGPDALTAGNYFANYFSPNRKVQDVLIQSRPGDVRAGLSYKAKRKLQDFAENPRPTLPGRILDRGPLAGGSAGAATGFGIGALADLVLDKINGGPRDPAISMKWLGTLLGGGVGATLGHYRRKINSPGYNSPEGQNYHRMTSTLTKQAAMFHDPRNVILEKLQGASDIGFAEKAKLAAAVRSMDAARAKQLADMVKASLGFGVGAIVARYLFGMNSLRGTMFGGILGVLGTGLYNKYLK